MSSNYLDLISYGKQGIIVADYAKIREVLINRFKLIYGSDIDLSSTSADGQWIEEQSLFFNNILQMVKQFYANLDPRKASGEFLDIIASYTNVMRLPATRSNVSVLIEGLTPNISYTTNEPLVLLDRNGTTWTCSAFTTNSSGTGIAIATCDEFGPIRAEVGFIYTTVELLNGVTITMQSDAIVGRNRENDSQLRARRNNSLSSKGTTVIESIISELLITTGILDATIYNNDTGANLTSKDGTVIPSNSIYVLLRKNENIDIPNEKIGSIIYEKKTPGIYTMISDITGDRKSYNYPNTLNITQTVNWKDCTPISPEIKIEITPRNFFVSGSDETSTGIIVGNNIIAYLNDLRLSEDIKYFELLSEVLYSDPLFRNINTYTVVSIKIDDVEGDYTNPDTYFKYTNIAISTSGSNVIITLT